MAFCGNCGRRMVDGNNFCTHCGAGEGPSVPVGETVQQQPKTQRPQTQYPKTQQQSRNQQSGVQYPQTQQPKNQQSGGQYSKTQQSQSMVTDFVPAEEGTKTKKKKTGLLIAIIAAVLVLAVAGGAIVLLNNNGLKNDGNETAMSNEKPVEEEPSLEAENTVVVEQDVQSNTGTQTEEPQNGKDPEGLAYSGTDAADKIANGELPYEGQTLTVWTGYAQDTDAVRVADDWIERFEELTGAEIEVKHWGTDLQTMLYPALDAGQDIDVFLVGSTIQLDLQKGHALDLTDYVENSDIRDRSYPILLDVIQSVSNNGRSYYAIPTNSSFSSFWYNKDIFADAGITQMPETIEEFEAACDAIVAAGYYPMALDSAYAASTFGALVERMVGEEIVGDLTMNGGFAENERFVAACQKVIDWKAKGYFEPDAPAIWPSSQNRLGLEQDTAMVYTGMWLPDEVDAMTGSALNWGCFKFPYDPTCADGTYGASVSCSCNMINKNTETPDLAWDFMYFMNTGDANKSITDAEGDLVDDMTQDALPTFEGAKEIMLTTTEVVNYAGGLHDNVDIKVSISQVVTDLYAGNYSTGLAAAQAFDALVK